ncbi:hypothetical protein QEH53_00990 [Pelagicoccus sp. SDUM812002]|nr:hypothetical protein [Pelagicoccus sp. SDUM812002]
MRLKKRNVDPRTSAGYSTALNDIKVRFSTKPLDAIRSSDLLHILNDLIEGGAEPVTIRNRFRDWRVFFNWIARKRYVKTNVLLEIDLATDLPAVESSAKHPMKLEHVEATMALFDSGCLDRNGNPLDISQYCLWAALQFFVGFRSSEADRFRYDWFELETKSICVPEWKRSEATGLKEKGAKTKDPWRISDIQPNFWKWFDRQPEKRRTGRIPVPGKRAWEKDIRPAILSKCGIVKWASNAKRDSFATYHISLHANPGRTALVLKHKNTVRLYESYLGTMVPPSIAEKYFSIVPDRS